jgi:glycosyltransferase involved in cell wall biosynthesis
MIKGPVGFLRKRVLMPLLYKRANRVICVSEGIRKEIIQMGVPKEKLKTIHNFFESPNLKPISIPSTYSRFHDMEFLLAVGRLHPQKNFKAAIDIFVGMLSTRSTLKLVLIGDGPEKAILTAHARNRGLSVFEPEMDIDSNFDVYFLGYQQPHYFMRHAKLFLLPSLWEGFPNVLLESMACGVPIIASDCDSGPREMLLVNEDTGFDPIDYPVVGLAGILMQIPNTAQAIRHWISVANNTLDDADLRKKLSEGGKVRILTFEKSRIVPQWTAIINEV